MIILTFLLIVLAIMVVFVVVFFTATGLTNLLPLIIPTIPLLAMMGSGMLGLIDMLLFFGGPDDRRLARTELKYLGMTFVFSGALWWASTHFLWGL
jgi:hypothetical protein